MAQEPSNGRMVHYTPAWPADQEVAGAEEGIALMAHVCFVHPDKRYVHLDVVDIKGQHHSRGPIAQSDDAAGTDASRGRWSWPVRV